MKKVQKDLINKIKKLKSVLYNNDTIRSLLLSKPRLAFFIEDLDTSVTDWDNLMMLCGQILYLFPAGEYPFTKEQFIVLNDLLDSITEIKEKGKQNARKNVSSSSK